MRGGEQTAGSEGSTLAPILSLLHSQVGRALALQGVC